MKKKSPSKTTRKEKCAAPKAPPKGKPWRAETSDTPEKYGDLQSPVLDDWQTPSQTAATVQSEHGSGSQPAQPQAAPQGPDGFGVEVALSMLSGTPDPFAMPEGNKLSLMLAFLEPLEHKQSPFAPPDPLAVGGDLCADWHRLACGPMNPFVTALGMRQPGSSIPRHLAVQAAKKCLEDLGCAANGARPYAFGWCLGYALAADKLFAKWGVTLREFTNPPLELRRYLFNQAADFTEKNIKVTRELMAGFLDGAQAAHDSEPGPSIVFRQRLCLAFHWREHQHSTPTKLVKLVGKWLPMTESQRRDLLREIAELDSFSSPASGKGKRYMQRLQRDCTA